MFQTPVKFVNLLTFIALTFALVPALLPSAQAQNAPLPAGTAAPLFTSTDLDGKAVDLKALRGKVVLVDFWATWCPPCVAATPMLQSLHKKFSAKGLTVIGLSVDDDSTKGKVPAFKKSKNLTYLLSANPKANQAAAEKYKVEGIPAIFLIDQKGIVRWSLSGFDSDSEEKLLTQMITDLLATKPATPTKTARK